MEVDVESGTCDAGWSASLDGVEGWELEGRWSDSPESKPVGSPFFELSKVEFATGLVVLDVVGPRDSPAVVVGAWCGASGGTAVGATPLAVVALGLPSDLSSVAVLLQENTPIERSKCVTCRCIQGLSGGVRIARGAKRRAIRGYWR